MKFIWGIIQLLFTAVLFSACSQKMNPEQNTSSIPERISAQPPCSDKIVFFSARSGNGDLYQYDLSSLEVDLYLSADSSLGAPRFNKFSNLLMFAQQGSDGRIIYEKNPKDNSVSSVMENPAVDEVPDWSPNANKIVYSKTISAGNYSLVVKDLDTENELVLLENSKESFYPVWSPDGSRIAFVLTNEEYSADIGIINTDGSGFLNVTSNKKVHGHPEWHPNGDRLLFYIFANGNADLYELNLDSDELIQLTYDSNNQLIGRYSPDGNKIVFGGVIEGDWEIFLMDSDGNNKQQLTFSPGFDGDPVWVSCN